MNRPILLVEDNPDDVELTRRAFRNSQPQRPINVARNGIEAIEAVLGSDTVPPPADLPALILLDLKLPVVDGFEVLRRIRAEERTRTLLVVILTSSTQPSDLESGYQLGANSYVRKPVSYRDFLGVAQQLASYWLALNEAPPHQHLTRQ